MTDDKDRELYNDADPDAALRRLESLGRGGDPAGGTPASSGPLPGSSGPPAPGRDAPPRPALRPRPSSSRAPIRSARWARLAAPVVFLAAVLVVFSLAWRTGVVGGGDGITPVTSPSPKASQTENQDGDEATAEPDEGATRSYTVKPGDTLSGIADRFETTVSEIEDLNADQDLRTLSPGQKLTVPRP